MIRQRLEGSARVSTLRSMVALIGWRVAAVQVSWQEEKQTGDKQTMLGSMRGKHRGREDNNLSTPF